MKKFFYIIILISIIGFSCDKVDSPYIEEVQNNNNGNDSTITFAQNVLIEDFTAHTCVNCPRAARALEDIHHTYGKQIIPLALHVSSLAQPYNNPFQLDLRTTEGTELDNEFGLSASGLPKGMISRTEYNSDIKVPDGEWLSAVSQIVNKEPLYGIKINAQIDTTENKISVTTDVYVLRDTTQNLMLCVYLTEDSLIGGQLDNEVAGDHIVNDYVFMHVFRKSLNGTWGEELSTSSTNLSKDDVITKKYENMAYDPTWVSKNLNIVAFIYDNNTKEVFQAEIFEL